MMFHLKHVLIKYEFQKHRMDHQSDILLRAAKTFWYYYYCYKIILSNRLVSGRELASLVGRITSGGPVFGNICRLMTRYCSISVALAQGWDSQVLS